MRRTSETAITGIVLTLILASFVLPVARVAFDNVHSSAWDQASYLQIAHWIRHRLALTNGNHHPLYPLLLAPFARRDIGTFTMAKVISITVSTAGLLAIYAVARRLVGLGGALAVTLLTAMNQQVRIAAGYADAEVLVVPLSVATWYWACRAVRDADGRRGGRYALVAGLLCGTLYLAKGTGPLFAVSFAAALLLTQGLRFGARRAIWVFAAAFAAVALPLLIFNLFRYGNPLYNFNTSHVMWLDRWPDAYVYSPEELPTLGTYLTSHTAGMAVQRLVDGLLRAPQQWYEASRPFWLPHRPAPWVTWAYSGLLLLLLGRLTRHAMRRWQARRGWLWISLVLVALFCVLFGWYAPIDDSPRFVLPLVPFIYIALLWVVRQETASRARLARWVSPALVAVCLLQAGSTLLLHRADFRLLAQMPAHDRQENRDTVAFMEVLLEHTQPDDAVVFGPTHALAEWLAFDRQLLPIPYVRQDWHSFSTWLAARGVRYVVVDYESWDRRRLLLGQYFDYDVGLQAAELPPGWGLVEPPTFPCNPCLFSYDGTSVAEPEPQVPAALVYDDAFTLLGYDVDPSPPRSGQPWRVTLSWQALRAVQDDVHVFVHVVDQNGQPVAQHDSVMAEGRLPASLLVPHTTVRDSHPLPPVPPGRYTLYVGMYRWETLERLPTFDDGRAVPDAYPSAGDIVVAADDG
jgi:hypothetical protein